jgi:hypothetical protein
MPGKFSIQNGMLIHALSAVRNSNPISVASIATAMNKTRMAMVWLNVFINVKLTNLTDNVACKSSRANAAGRFYSQSQAVATGATPFTWKRWKTGTHSEAPRVVTGKTLIFFAFFAFFCGQEFRINPEPAQTTICAGNAEF